MFLPKYNKLLSPFALYYDFTTSDLKILDTLRNPIAYSCKDYSTCFSVCLSWNFSGMTFASGCDVERFVTNVERRFEVMCSICEPSQEVRFIVKAILADTPETINLHQDCIDTTVVLYGMFVHRSSCWSRSL